MEDIITVLSILVATLSILVGFLLLFLQFYPQRKRNFQQQLALKMIEKPNIEDKLKGLYDKVDKTDKIIFEIDINRTNFYVFLYNILILSFSLFLIILYIFNKIIPDIVIVIMIILTIIGYILLIPIVKLSFLDTRYIDTDDED